MSDFYGNTNEHRWYIVQTYSGYEKKVVESLKERIEKLEVGDRIRPEDIRIPEQMKTYIKDGKSIQKRVKLFPGYLLINMALDEQTWFCVRHTPGVSGFVGSGNHPIPLTPQEADAILSKIAPDDKPKVDIKLALGDMVQTKSGPFAHMPGPVVEIDDDKAKIKFRVDIFGRETDVEVDYADLEKI